MSRPTLSVVVVTYDHERELPRTLYSLLPPHQRNVDPDDLEVIIVDNGSRRPAADLVEPGLAMRATFHRLDPAPPSPAAAANVGLEVATGDAVGLVIDGARMASPRLLHTAVLASQLDARAIVTAPAWHLGHAVHGTPGAIGHDEEAEDALLADSGWEQDGYQLFDIAVPAGSSARGLFGPMGESSSLFMRRELWAELGGLDEQFALAGGGLVNHDLYRRACELPGAQLFVLLGEGTFHQVHGGAATSGRTARDAMQHEYMRIRGEAHRPPVQAPLYVGSVPAQYRPYLCWSAERAIAVTERAPLR